MNIVHLTPYYAPAYAFGGVTRAVEGMARTLARRGHQVSVLTTDALSQHERYTGALDSVQDGVRVVRVRNLSTWLRGRLNLSTPPGMGRLAADLLADADILHIHELRTSENLLVTPVMAWTMPIVLSPHGTLTLGTGRGAQGDVGSAAVAHAGTAHRRRDRADGAGSRRSAGGMGGAWSPIVTNSLRRRAERHRPGEFVHLPGREAFRARSGWVTRRCACSWGGCTRARASTCWRERFCAPTCRAHDW
ncbi:MAG: glycosyltransferase [Anaerolineae bacterium]